MTPLSAKFVKAVSPDLPFVPSRLCVVFGNQNRDIVRRMAHHAAKLYINGLTRKMIVTGGVPFDDNKDLSTEAEYARKILLGYGISGKNILLENKSTNSFENVVNARRILRANERRLEREPVIFLGQKYAAARFLMTIAKNWPEVTPTFVGFHNFDRDAKYWHTCPQITGVLYHDRMKWDGYIQKGHIRPVNIDHLVRKLHPLKKRMP